MKKVNYDVNGKILGFYSKDIHSNIPEPNIEITDDQWKNILSDVSSYRVINNALVLYTLSISEKDGLLANLKTSKMIHLNTEEQRRINAICSPLMQSYAIMDILEILIKENKSYNDILNAVPGAVRYEPTADEKVAMTKCNSDKVTINSIRNKAAEIEIAINAMNYDTLVVYDVTDNNNWT